MSGVDISFTNRNRSECAIPIERATENRVLVWLFVFVIEERPFVFAILTRAAVHVSLAGAQFEQRCDDDADDQRHAEQHADPNVCFEEEMVYRSEIHVVCLT